MSLEHVPSTRVDEILQEAAPDLLARGFTSLGSRKWAKRIDDDIVHMVDVSGIGNGPAELEFRWGVSLSFVPNEWKVDHPRFHRTLKGARFDVWTRALEEDLRAGSTPQPRIPRLHGENAFRDALFATWPGTVDILDRWLRSAVALEGVMERALEQVSHPVGHDGLHSTRQEMVLAFICARLGRTAEQSMWRDRYAERDKVRDDLVRLDAALANAARHTSAS